MKVINGAAKSKEFSIKRRMLFILMGVLIPVVLFMIIYNFFVVDAANKNQADTSISTLRLYCVQIERCIEALDNNMSNIVGTDNSFISLTYRGYSSTSVHLSAVEVTNRYEELMNSEEALAACLLISEPNDIYRAKFREDIQGYENKEGIISWFKDKVLDGEELATKGWKYAVIMERPFLYQCLGFRGTYCICLLDIESFPVPQNFDNGTLSRIIFMGEDRILTGQQFIEENKIKLPMMDEEGTGYYFSGEPQKYMVSYADIDGTNVSAVYLMPYRGMLEMLSSIQHLLVLLSFLMVMVIPIGYWLLKKTFFYPVDRLVAEMEEIQKKQDAMTMVPDEAYPEVEFRKVNATLNNMLGQIRTLKIDAYEKQLHIQQISLQYYQIQIRPHFFLNCLKNIYGMAEEQNYEGIQKCILYLSNHLRYMMRDDARVVTLEEELQYVRNYILLQQLSAKYPPECIIDVAGDMMNLKVPAISVLSFVENAVKYYAGETTGLKIHIRLNMLANEEGDISNITIQDNGMGFTQEQLSEYNYYDQSSNHGEHVGIYNVIQRFLLYYGRENVWFAFSNNNGAQVDIFIKNCRQERKDESYHS